MKNFFKVYQYIAVLFIFPFTVYIWSVSLKNNWHCFYVIALPVVVSYVIPGIGTNVTKLWEINTRFRAGKFRVYHGFVLGSSVSLFGYVCHSLSPVYTGIVNTLFFSIVLASFVGFWNWFYDIKAIEHGFIIVYNKNEYEKKGAAEIATAYAPIYFGMLGFIYGLYLKYGQFYFGSSNKNIIYGFCIGLLCLAALLIPTASYAFFSYIKYKDFCISKYIPKGDKK